MTHRPKSLASDLFKLLVENFPIDSLFTATEFGAVAKIKGMNASQGAVQGFIHRAKSKNVIKQTGYVLTDRGQKAYVYTVMSHDGWGFHGPSPGSKKGRSIKGAKHVFGDKVEDITVISSPSNKPKDKPQVQPVDDWAQSEVKAGTAKEAIFDRLMEIGALVNALVNETKPITAFSDDEIADEVKRRFHSK